ncbi:hypothetical protein [Nitrospirillum amazonense]|uniref:hypothetical protein n=1 Tax=Nitrospirillum amazonense TaxID=28077 RepID=UPI00119F7FB8|nr:hypothetical protein [Nitrospirillum amazonense]
MDVFDLAQVPDQIRPDFMCFGLFLSIGLGLLVMAIMAPRFNRPGFGLEGRAWMMRWLILPFSIVWLIFFSAGAYFDFRYAYEAQADVRAGRYHTVQGCLTHFYPGSPRSRLSRDFERWRVAGMDFAYADEKIGFGYHALEMHGGIVHADSKVQVSYVRRLSGRNDIVRLEVWQHACPVAPDMS